jgi:hypothetical protein
MTADTEKAVERAHHISKINDMWWSGYCHETIEVAIRSFNDEDGGQAQRLAWLGEHIHECKECSRANLWKALEAELARRISPEALHKFFQGENIFQYKAEADRLLPELLKETKFSAEMIEFAERVAKRHGKPYPNLAELRGWKR